MGQGSAKQFGMQGQQAGPATLQRPVMTCFTLSTTAAARKPCPEGWSCCSQPSFHAPSSCQYHPPPTTQPSSASPAWVSVQYPQAACLWVPAAPQQAYDLTPTQVHMDVHQHHGLHNTQHRGSGGQLRLFQVRAQDCLLAAYRVVTS
jgi:hypothetical protein